MEFIGMVAIAIFVMMFIMGISGELIRRNEIDKKSLIFHDYGSYLLHEIIIASEAKEGYQRSITIPDDIENFNFEVDNDENYLTLNYSGGTLSFLTPKSEGHFIKGENTINNFNGTVCINC